MSVGASKVAAWGRGHPSARLLCSVVIEHADRQVTAPIDPEALVMARAAVPDEETVAGVVAAFQLLGDTTRARILYALVRTSLCVRDLALVAEVSESAVSHQLRLLRERHLVKPHRQGNVITYSLEDHHLAALFREAEYHADHVRQALPDHPYP
jgi:ArsR family transcriptional regulator, lead/cadmium/zinc/bismuth-responsive transcriptional repressor